MKRRPRITYATVACATLTAALIAAPGCGDGDGTVGPPPPPGPSAGSIVVSTQTSPETGEAVLDPDGYTVTIDGLDPRDIGLNGTVTYADVAAGDHDVDLEGMQVNCTTPQNPIRVSVVGGATAQAAFELTCLAPTAGRIAFSASPDGPIEIYTINPNGTDLRRLTDAGHPGMFAGAGFMWPAWSPDGWKIAYVYIAGETDWDVWVMNADGTDQRALTMGGRRDGWPAWSPDGSKIAFASDRGGGNLDVYVMDADGTDQVQLTDHPEDDLGAEWLPDGSRILFGSERDGHAQIYVMNTDGTDERNLSNNAEWDALGACSPDGSKILFGRDGEIYLMNVDGSGVTRLTDGPTAKEPTAWSPDGTKILYMNWSTGWIHHMMLDGSVTVPVTAGIGGGQHWFADWSHGTGDVGG